MFIPRNSEQWTALGYIAGWKVVGALPERLTMKVAYRIADKIAADPEGSTKQLRKNLSRVIGSEPSAELVRASMRSYLRYWVEAFRLPRIVAPALLRQVGDGINDRSILDNAVARGKGVVLVITHSGNWDMAGIWLANEVGGFATVAERLRPEALYDAFVDYRESLGFTVLPLTGGEPPLGQLRQTLLDGGVVCLLGDRDIAGDGVPVTFFGEETTMPRGSALLARETGAALIVVSCHFPKEGDWGIDLYPEIPTQGREIEDIVADQARDIESVVRNHPADWHVLQPFWKRDRKTRRRHR